MAIETVVFEEISLAGAMYEQWHMKVKARG
jgi:hypothetical protein